MKQAGLAWDEQSYLTGRLILAQAHNRGWKQTFLNYEHVPHGAVLNSATKAHVENTNALAEGAWTNGHTESSRVLHHLQCRNNHKWVIVEDLMLPVMRNRV
jgi:hypothetical protein